MRYTARIRNNSGAGFDIPYTAPNDEAAKATAVLMVSALQEPKNKGCWARLKVAIGEYWAGQMNSLTREIGQYFSVEVVDLFDQHVEAFSSQAKVKREHPDWEKLPQIGEDEIDQYVEQVR